MNAATNRLERDETAAPDVNSGEGKWRVVSGGKEIQRETNKIRENHRRGSLPLPCSDS